MDGNTLEVSIAVNKKDCIDALKLVYDNYLEKGLISANEHGMRIIQNHRNKETDIIVGKSRGTIISTGTLIYDGDLGLPIEHIFADRIKELREQKIVCAEASCLASRKNAPIIKVMSFIIQCAEYNDVDMLLIAVHPRHSKFYKRKLGFNILDEQEKPCDYVKGSPAIAMFIDLSEIYRDKGEVYDRIYKYHFNEENFNNKRSSGFFDDLNI